MSTHEVVGSLDLATRSPCEFFLKRCHLSRAKRFTQHIFVAARASRQMRSCDAADATKAAESPMTLTCRPSGASTHSSCLVGWARRDGRQCRGHRSSLITLGLKAANLVRTGHLLRRHPIHLNSLRKSLPSHLSTYTLRPPTCRILDQPKLTTSSTLY